MKHMMLDCYGANRDMLNDLKYITYILNEMASELEVKPICPPQLVPYYYGKITEDDGISAYILLEGGHITIHTFPFRECYFVDIFSPIKFDEQKLTSLLLNRLAFDLNISKISVRDRTVDSNEVFEYDSSKDFGPHVLIKTQCDKLITMEEVFDFLERIVPQIDMTPITRACVLKNKVNKPKYLSGIVLIAQSHISLHFNYQTKEVFFDIFSCASFDYSKLGELLKDFGTITSNEMVARGSKHWSLVKRDPFNSRKKASKAWIKQTK